MKAAFGTLQLLLGLLLVTTTCSSGVAGWQWPSWGEVAKQGLMWSLPRGKQAQQTALQYSITGQLQHYASPYLYFPAPFTTTANATVGDVMHAASLASHAPVSLADLRYASSYAHVPPGMALNLPGYPAIPPVPTTVSMTDTQHVRAYATAYHLTLVEFQASNPRTNVMDFNEPTTLRVPTVPSSHAVACPPHCHCVRPGEALEDIALLMGTTTAALTAVNPNVLRQGNRLFVGQALTVPLTADTAPALPSAVEVEALQSPYAVLLRIPGLPLTATYLHSVAKANGMTLRELMHVRVRSTHLRLPDADGKLHETVESPSVQVDHVVAAMQGMDMVGDVDDDADDAEDEEDGDDDALGFDRFPGDDRPLPLPKKQLPPPSNPPTATDVPQAPVRRALQTYARLPITVSAKAASSPGAERRSMITEEPSQVLLPWEAQEQAKVLDNGGFFLQEVGVGDDVDDGDDGDDGAPAQPVEDEEEDEDEDEDDEGIDLPVGPASTDFDTEEREDDAAPSGLLHWALFTAQSLLGSKDAQGPAAGVPEGPGLPVDGFVAEAGGDGDEEDDDEADTDGGLAGAMTTDPVSVFQSEAGLASSDAGSAVDSCSMESFFGSTGTGDGDEEDEEEDGEVYEARPGDVSPPLEGVSLLDSFFAPTQPLVVGEDDDEVVDEDDE